MRIRSCNQRVVCLMGVTLLITLVDWVRYISIQKQSMFKVAGRRLEPEASLSPQKHHHRLIHLLNKFFRNCGTGLFIDKMKTTCLYYSKSLVKIPQTNEKILRLSVCVSMTRVLEIKCKKTCDNLLFLWRFYKPWASAL